MTKNNLNQRNKLENYLFKPKFDYENKAINRFEKDEISNAFSARLEQFLIELDETKIPSNYTAFYNMYKKSNEVKNKKIKFNNKIIHQSKVLNYFNEDSDKKNIKKDLENLLKKVKKDKKYFFSIKDLIMLESLKSDGIELPKKYENIY